MLDNIVSLNERNILIHNFVDVRKIITKPNLLWKYELKFFLWCFSF